MTENSKQPRGNRNRVRWRIRAIRGGKWWRERGHKSLSTIPHLFTLLNLACGIFSIMQTLQGNYRIAAWMVAGSLLADGLDGRIARILKADGEFGKELDSLADVVSFGTAPAILLHTIALSQLENYGLAIALLFPLSGALRLARFNIVKTSGFFMGVPITAAGTFVAAICFYILQENAVTPSVFLIAAVTLLLSYLMISTIPYPDFKKLVRKGGEFPVWQVAAGPAAIALWVMAGTEWSLWAVLMLPLAAYATLGPWLLMLREWRARTRPSTSGSN